MSVHFLFNVIFRATRGKRMRWFERTLPCDNETTILDVGGTPGNWSYLSSRPRVVMLNLMVTEQTAELPEHLTYLQGDALAMTCSDGQYDIGFSNSVIEHMGTWENQRRFAEQLRRVARGLWVQTPALGFPIEPHFLAPFVHWTPKPWRKALLRYFTPWGWLERPSREKVEQTVEEIRLLSYREMRELFPDCEIFIERVLFWPKSYIAVRRLPKVTLPTPNAPARSAA
ncbi:MAG: class I SAM-dependent methyltransferase [Pirellulaceae bacterium]